MTDKKYDPLILVDDRHSLKDKDDEVYQWYPRIRTLTKADFTTKGWELPPVNKPEEQYECRSASASCQYELRLELYAELVDYVPPKLRQTKLRGTDGSEDL